MKKQLFLIISAVLLSSWLSGSYFYQKGKSEALYQSISILSNYVPLNNVTAEVHEIISSDTKGDRIKNSLYLLRNVEIVNVSLSNISTLMGSDADFSIITNELSLAAADISTYIHQDSLGFDTQKAKEKLLNHGEALRLITETLTREDLRFMDLDRISNKLSRLQDSLPH
ncbi:hypothetical protein [Brevibacillus choshinensis]|uniref:hypothetical protein n=1 Tax=Brevibacillus choshinensis TaxID=54911 RepID=UPI002E1C33FA|nr:hypothetical protein [Brevibacillus choshinensis]